MSTNQYTVGDVVNNHRLEQDGTWTPLVQAPPPAVDPSALHAMFATEPAKLSEIVLPSKKKSFGKRLIVGLVVGFAILVVGGIASTAISGGSKSGGSSTDTVSSTDLTNPTVLAASVKDSYQAALTKNGAGTITDVTCVATAVDHQFKCLVTATGGGQEMTASHTVTVAPDGSTWLADHE